MKKSNVTRVFIYIMALIIVLTMSACGTNNPEGYESGYDSGFRDGYKEGYSDGENQGYNEAREEAAFEYEAGYNEGLTDYSERKRALEDLRDRIGDDLYFAYEEGRISKATLDSLLDDVYNNYYQVLGE